MSDKNNRATWLQGDHAECSVPPKPRALPARIVLLGAPGVGKGTQAELLCAGLGVCHLSTGDVFRASHQVSTCERSDTMNAALDHMNRGELIPDDVVLKLLRERARCLNCRGGFLLDGFPRSVPQAEALAQILAEYDLRLEAALSYVLPVSTIVSRLSGRRTCPHCKAVYHVSARPSLVPGVCDHCGAKLIQRVDDQPEAVRVRMEAYEASAKPLMEYYASHGLLRTISADGTPERIYERTLAILDN